MDKGKGIAVERGEEGETNNTFVSSAAFHDDIVKLLDFIERSKNEIDPLVFYGKGRLENMKLNLTILLRLFQFSYPDFDDFKATISRVSYEIQSEVDVVHAIFRLLDYIKCSISTQHQVRTTMTWEQLVELLGSIIFVKLHDLSRVESFFPLMSQYESLQNVCGIIRDFHELKVNGCIEPQIIEYAILQFQLMAGRVGYFCWVVLADQLKIFVDHFVEQIDLPLVDPILANLLLEIVPIELEVMRLCFTELRASKSAEVGRFITQLLKATPDILREYLNHLEIHMVNLTSSNTSTQKIHATVEFLLLILIDMHKDFIYLDKLVDLLAHVVVVTMEVSILFRLLKDKSRSEKCTIEIDCSAMYLLENIERLKGDLKHVYLKAPDQDELCFQMSDGPLFMSLLLGHLKGLFNSNAYSVALIKEEIGIVKEDLEFIRSFFGKIEQELYKDLWKRILDVAYEVKYVINSILVRDDGLLHIIFSLPNAIEKIKLMKDEVSILHEKTPKNSHLILKQSVKNKSFVAGQIAVGFKEERDWIIRKLTNGPRELDVISIIGMPGLGKTTLAYDVYNDRSVISHFDIRAWCTVDQEYDMKMILQKILNQVTYLDEKFNDDIVDILRKKLYGRRYLIFLDDLWDTASWDDLTRPFPQVEKGSRIILTSRNKEVALPGKRHSDPLELRLLRPEESWELLERRVFQEENCPVELQDVGKQIAQNCQGLPLVVSLIAGVIAVRKKEKIVWLELLRNLKSFVFNNEDEVMKVIQLSYEQLTDHLKLCFLYLGSYKKDEQIEVDELKALWSAEGFVEEIEMKSVEEVTEDYLGHLVSSSLVMVSKGVRGYKFCRIHDLLHDFCLVKARTENIFDMISSTAASSSSSDLMPRQLTIHYDDQSYDNIVAFNFEKARDSSGNGLLSLKITRGSYYVDLSHFYHVRHFSLLRVLNIGIGRIDVADYLLNEIALLVHLRYLNIRTMRIKALPSSFSNLCNLETLVVDNIGNPSMTVEPVIGDLVMLQFLDIRSCHLYALGTDEQALLAEVSKLENLRVLAQLKLFCSKGPVDISKRFPNLQKLFCKVMESWDSSAGCNWFPQFGFLNELEELSVFGPGYAKPSEDTSNPDQIMSFEVRHLSKFAFFPSSLKYLQLTYGLVNSDSLSTIARLPNLEELYLSRLCIQGKEWNMQQDDTFKNLKLLDMRSVTLSKWQVGDEQFPVLEHLILHSCEELEEIPPSFGDIYSLKSIELQHNRQLEESALEIKRYVEDLTGDDKLQVINK